MRRQLLVHRLPHVRPHMCDRNQTHVGSISNAGRCCASTPSSPTCALRCALRCGRRACRCASRGAGGLQRSSPLLMDAVPGCDFVVLRFVGSAVARRELDAPKLPRQLPTLACPIAYLEIPHRRRRLRRSGGAYPTRATATAPGWPRSGGGRPAWLLRWRRSWTSGAEVQQAPVYALDNCCSCL